MTDTLTELTDGEIDAVVAVVSALAERNVHVLSEHGAYERGANPYMYVDDYDAEGGVDIVLPPGNARSWPAYVFRSEDRPGWAAVDVQIWDRRRGETDLIVELELSTGSDGNVEVIFRDLHVP